VRVRRDTGRPPIDVGGGGILSYDLATGADAAGPEPPSEYLRGVRGDTLLGSSDRVLDFGMPLPFVPFAFNGTIALASLSGATPPRAFSTPGGGAPTLGVSAIFQAGGTAVRAYDVAASHPGCGSDGTLECPLWETPIDGTGTDPVLAPGGSSTLYVATAAGTVYALDAATGAVLWSAPVGAAVTAPPALAEGALFLPTADQRLVALAASDGGLLWDAATDGVVGVQPAVAAGVAYTGSQTGAVEAFTTAGCGDDTTCPHRWSAAAGAAVTGAPAVASGSLYVGTADGHLVAYRRPGT
jgi:outer membrane protein assembly factor BamB